MVISIDFGIGKLTGCGVLEHLLQHCKPYFSPVKQEIITNYAVVSKCDNTIIWKEIDMVHDIL